MHSDLKLLERLERILPASLDPKRMFGGQCWMLNGKMCVGVYHEYLITRIGPEAYAKIASEPGVGPMDITGKLMKGWAKVSPNGLTSDAELKKHVELAVTFVETLS